MKYKWTFVNIIWKTILQIRSDKLVLKSLLIFYKKVYYEDNYEEGPRVYSNLLDIRILFVEY